MLFKYALPVVIGFVLCVGISGQLWPLRKPHHLAHRPAWLLGLWAGCAVALTLMLALNLAYHQPSITVSNLAIPSLSLLATTILPGFLVFMWYRRHINEELISEHRKQHIEEYTQSEIAKFTELKNEQSERTEKFDATWSDSFDDVDSIAEMTVNDDVMPNQTTESDTDGDTNRKKIFDAAFDAAFTETQQKMTSQKIVAGMSHVVAIDDVDTVNVIEEVTQEERFEKQLLAREEEIREEMTAAAEARLEQQAIDHQQTLAEALKSAEQEGKLREEIENNLRITRKAMIQLEARTRKLEMDRNDELIALEQQLDDQIRDNSKLEAAVDREKQKTAALEKEMQNSSEQLLKAHTELRKNTAARAKALASANKAVTFARQAVDARAQSESRLSSIKDRVIAQQTTISSLIKALDTEKTSNKDELAFLQAQLVEKDSELESLTRGEAANQPLTTRLVKKVAKPRTVASS